MKAPILATVMAVSVFLAMFASYVYDEHFDGFGNSIGEANELSPIELTFSITDNVTVKHGNDVISNGDVYTFHGDATLTVTTNDGLAHDITYSGSWTNGDESGSCSGDELGNSIQISIVDCIYWGTAHGTMQIAY